LKQRLVKGNESIIKTADSIYYLTLKDGFARIDLPDLIRFRESESLQKPFFKGFSDQRTGYDLNTNPLIPYKNSRSLKISVGHPGSASSDLRYELQGSHTIKGKIPDGSITFQNLSHGDYKLKIFAITPEGITSPSAAMEFTVDAPWYFSIPMKMLYIMVLLLTVLTIYLLNKRKLRKHRLLLEEELKKEHEAQMEQLEKKRLKDEIMMKRKELANTTMIAAKKNEVLMDIQGELNKDRDKFSNQYRLKHIMNKINQAIKDKDEWQVFETNFKEVHEDFSKDLLEKYPKLTAKDLKLCSYLKMNLTSKEIAPLMGKSLRGVEVHRYRLRKKMDLDSQENLTAFLIKNF
jgi:AraC family transcriptional regulator, chitin signaling transcriptional activator